MVAEGVHVLMVTLPFQGHINPMLRFAKRLVSKGLHVTLATTEVARQRLINCNMSSTTTTTQNAVNTTTTTQNAVSTETETESPKIHLEFFSDGLTLDLNRGEHSDLMFNSLALKGSKNLSNLITNILANKGRKFCCIINQPFVPWVADVAAEHGIPCAMLYIQASTLYAIYYRYYNRLDSFPSLEDPNAVLALPGLPFLEVKDLPTFILPSSPHHFKKLVSDSVRSLEKVKWVLGSSFYELEADVVQSMALINPVLPVGPLVPSVLLGKEETIAGGIDMWNAEDSCLVWLDKNPPSSVVYVAFGSATVLARNQIQNLAMALKNCNRPFLWVVRPPEENFEMENGELPLGFLEETDGRGLVVSWCAQEKVLTHQAVACFMSHCGWNSTLEAVVAGVPVIACPGWLDQPTDAKLIVDVFKMGVRMWAGEDGIVTKEEIERCIFEITDGPTAREIKRKAMDWREAARKAVADGGSSDRNVDYFISQIIGQSAKTL